MTFGCSAKILSDKFIDTASGDVLVFLKFLKHELQKNVGGVGFLCNKFFRKGILANFRRIVAILTILP